MTDNNSRIKVCALYKFTTLTNYVALRQPVSEKLRELGIKGTILLAREGINGTIAGAETSVEEFVCWLEQFDGLSAIDTKISYTTKPPFKRAKVKLKKEIVSMGVEGIDPGQSAGTYVDPKDWNDLLDDPEVLVIDTRNEYEINVGKFANSVNPHTTNFRQFPEFANKNLDSNRHKKIAMYCTGGIRCEKSTAYLKQNGFSEVYHLKGGILKYLEHVPGNESRWQGECFVFDDRVTVDSNLKKGSYDQCHACRMPISETDKADVKYQAGVSCPACYDQSSDYDKQRFAEREKQIRLAVKRGEVHIGPAEPEKT